MRESKSNSVMDNFEKIVDLIIRLGMLFLLIFWCFDILKPFILVIIWAIVIAIAIYPIYTGLVRILRGRRILAIIILNTLFLSIIIAPSVLVTNSLYDGVTHIKEVYEKEGHLIPPPDESTKKWPAIVKPVVKIWQSASDNLQKTTLEYSDQVGAAGKWIFSAFGEIGKGITQFIISIVIAGFLLAYAESLMEVSKKIFVKLAGRNGDQFALVTVMTIRNVLKGFLVVAVIQATMAGLGFFIAGVPFAGLWTVICLVLAIVQIGVGPIAIPVAAYMFAYADTTTAVVLSVWLGITMIVDNILKPILLGKNTPVPMPVVFLGAIGGFICYGFLGLFLGSVILTIGYKLFIVWLDIENQEI